MTRILLILSVVCTFLACKKEQSAKEETQNQNPGGSGNGQNPPGNKTEAAFDDSPENAPRFVNYNYIEIDSIGEISLFRSGIGHDYSDDFESCRSMKHYFKPKVSDWSQVKIFAPVDGEVVMVFSEWAGSQIHIRSKQYPAFTFKIFHVNLEPDINVGDDVVAGQQIGTHIGTMTMSDIAVAAHSTIDGPKENSNSEKGLRLISFFQVMSDSLFSTYAVRGIQSRDDLIMSKEARDADELSCDGEAFEAAGNEWVEME